MLGWVLSAVGGGAALLWVASRLRTARHGGLAVRGAPEPKVPEFGAALEGLGFRPEREIGVEVWTHADAAVVWRFWAPAKRPGPPGVRVEVSIGGLPSHVRASSSERPMPVPEEAPGLGLLVDTLPVVVDLPRRERAPQSLGVAVLVHALWCAGHFRGASGWHIQDGELTVSLAQSPGRALEETAAEVQETARLLRRTLERPAKLIEALATEQERWRTVCGPPPAASYAPGARLALWSWAREEPRKARRFVRQWRAPDAPDLVFAKAWVLDTSEAWVTALRTPHAEPRLYAQGAFHWLTSMAPSLRDDALDTLEEGAPWAMARVFPELVRIMDRHLATWVARRVIDRFSRDRRPGWWRRSHADHGPSMAGALGGDAGRDFLRQWEAHVPHLSVWALAEGYRQVGDREDVPRLRAMQEGAAPDDWATIELAIQAIQERLGEHLRGGVMLADAAAESGGLSLTKASGGEVTVAEE